MNQRARRFRKLDLAIARLKRLVESGGSELVRDGRVRSALRELEESRKGGQADLDRMVLAVTLIGEAVCDKFDVDDDRRQ